MAAGSWYSVLRTRSSNFCSLLCALDADLISMKETVAHTPEPSSSFARGSSLTLCTRPYLQNFNKSQYSIVHTTIDSTCCCVPWSWTSRALVQLTQFCSLMICTCLFLPNLTSKTVQYCTYNTIDSTCRFSLSNYSTHKLSPCQLDLWQHLDTLLLPISVNFNITTKTRNTYFNFCTYVILLIVVCLVHKLQR